MALGIFAAVTVIIASIMETTFKAQRQAELKSDLQSFFMRLNQEIDCEKTFKVGDSVSYRVTGSLEGFPFVGTLIEVHDDYVLISGDPNEPDKHYRGTRESRPLVDYSEI